MFSIVVLVLTLGTSLVLKVSPSLLIFLVIVVSSKARGCLTASFVACNQLLVASARPSLCNTSLIVTLVGRDVVSISVLICPSSSRAVSSASRLVVVAVVSVVGSIIILPSFVVSVVSSNSVVLLVVLVVLPLINLLLVI